MRMANEVDSILVPFVKRVEYFKEAKVKDQSYLDVASALKYETHPKDTIITDLGISSQRYKVFSGL